MLIHRFGFRVQDRFGGRHIRTLSSLFQRPIKASRPSISLFWWCAVDCVGNIKSKQVTLGVTRTRHKSFLISKIRQPWHTECCQLIFGRYFLRSNQPCSGMLTKRHILPVNTRQPHFDAIRIFGMASFGLLHPVGSHRCKGKHNLPHFGFFLRCKCFANVGGRAEQIHGWARLSSERGYRVERLQG